MRVTNSKDRQRRSNVQIIGAPEKESQSKGTEQMLRTIIHENRNANHRMKDLSVPEDINSN